MHCLNAYSEKKYYSSEQSSGREMLPDIWESKDQNKQVG